MAKILAVAVSSMLLCALTAQQADPTPKTEPPAPAQPVEIKGTGQWNSAVGLGGSSGGLYGMRRGGRSGDAASAIAYGSTWLNTHRDENGRWTGADPADQGTSITVTSLAVLAMLGQGSTLRSGPFKDAVKTGVSYLRSVQRDDGAFLPKDSNDVLAHAIATNAVAEAYLLSNYKLLQRNTDQALAWLDGRRGDDGTHPLTVGGKADAIATLWSRLARMTGEYAGSVQKAGDRQAIAAWLQTDDAGRLLERSLLPTAALPGADLALRQELDAAKLVLAEFVREQAKEPDAGTIAKVRDRQREWRKGVDLHEWFCASHLLQQVGSGADVDKVCAPLIEAQVGEGENRGSWDPIDLCGDVGGRAWSTAMALLTIEAKIRYTKRFR
ncbi:MAG: terpene cyclase/mutase family protein [Planctomycetes bacterium]|nr:terpene cyclase/mutase family protein [Planctomycetota bacterium]